LNRSTISPNLLAAVVKHFKYSILQSSIWDEPQPNFRHCSNRRSYDSDCSGVRYTTTSFGIQTSQPQPQPQQQFKSWSTDQSTQQLYSIAMQ